MIFYPPALKTAAPSANFNTCLQRSHGHWVHVLHGDDLVLDGFSARMRQVLEGQPRVQPPSCQGDAWSTARSNWISLRDLMMDAPGIGEGLLEKLSGGNCLQFAGVVIRREAVERLGGFCPQLIHAADWEMWMRIAAQYQVWYEPQPLACYREHGSSDTSRLKRSGEDVRDFRRAIAMADPYMSAKLGSCQWEGSRNFLGTLHVRHIANANRMLLSGDKEGMRAQAREARLSSQSPFIRRMYWHYITRPRLAPRRVLAAMMKKFASKSGPPSVPGQPART